MNIVDNDTVSFTDIDKTSETTTCGTHGYTYPYPGVGCPHCNPCPTCGRGPRRYFFPRYEPIWAAPQWGNL